MGRAGPAQAAAAIAVVRHAGGDWLPQWDKAAQRAVEGRYLENGRISEALQRKGLKPETRFRPDEAERGERRVREVKGVVASKQ